jgi:tRNA pseudouridine38-40 synthase
VGVAVRTFRAVLEYDGTDFSGWQAQPGRRTVQGVLEEALERITGARSPVVAAGRTDAGVHALGQVVSFRSGTGIPPRDLARALNALLPPDAAVLSLAAAREEFHANRDARSKVYRYSLVAGGPRRPSLRRVAWWLPRPLDLDAMRAAAAPLVGRHDFRSFRTNPGEGADRRSTVRTLRRIGIRRRAGRVDLEFEGDGFLHHMVRNLVGTLVQVGRGAWPPGRVAAALRARDRRAAGPSAPALGLALVSVSYGPGTRSGAGEGKIGPASRGARRIGGLGRRPAAGSRSREERR